MNLQPIDRQQIEKTVQILLSILDSDAVNIPGNLSEGLTSGKSLLRGILQGNVVVCHDMPAPPPPVEPEESEDEPETE